MEGTTPNNNNSCTRQVLEKKARPQEQLNCPRCNSTNTKFCYYNNYSLTQPRYFCKTCRRYWTEGGSLRNVPVGGGSRKNKKIINNNSSSSISIYSSPSPSSSAPASASAATTTSSKVIIHQDLVNPNKMLQGGGQDLNLAFSMDKYHHHGLSLPFVDNSSPSSSSPSSLSALELLRSSMASRGLSPYAPSNPLIPNSSSALYPSSGFPMQEVNKANNNILGFSMDHGTGNNRSNYDDHVQENNSNNGGRILFPFGEVKQQHLSSSGGDHGVENNKEQGNSSTGYWAGMIGEGSW